MLTVAALIAELQRMPNQHAPVRVVLSRVTLGADHEPHDEPLGDEDALDADEVVHMGPWVLIRSR